MNDEKEKTKSQYGSLSIIFAIIAFLVLPIIFAPLAIIFGIIAISKRDTKLGIAGIVLAVAAVIIRYLIFLWVSSL